MAPVQETLPLSQDQLHQAQGLLATCLAKYCAAAQMPRVHPYRVAIYAHIVTRLLTGELPPTVRELAEAVGIESTGHIVYHLTWLYRQELLTRKSQTSVICRGITPAHWIAGHPVIGILSCGILLSCLRILDRGTMSPCVPYALLLADDALCEQHLCSGDYIIIEPRVFPLYTGQLVIVHMQDADTPSIFVAKVQEDRRLVCLTTEPKPVLYESDTCRVQGVIGRVVRLIT